MSEYDQEYIDNALKIITWNAEDISEWDAYNDDFANVEVNNLNTAIKLLKERIKQHEQK